METLDKEQQIERLYATTPVYEWELIINPDHGRTKVTYGLFLVLVLIGGATLFFSPDSSGVMVAVSLIFVGSFMCPWYRYLINADKRHYYVINQYGMYSTSEQIIPEIAYTIVRRSAWVGCAICVFAAIFIGPMAFVGAGGAALMSFTMTNFRSVPHKSQCLFDGYVNFEYYKSCKSFINTKENFFACIIPEEKIAAIENTLLQFNETFEKEYIDDFEDAPKFQAFPVILEIVR
ncbi:hypothetical protein C9J19_20480 [Photobacterium phosphoreum]|uniref:hypothetical protein n=1 Tax=Photobacterium phosphoreum TaxID=659 RepID=UPI000D16015F|nr:hypothetical protein [Photobacterium phosphoreum]PSW23952.1 hypothetical protein C9J19_20480 [Photobacterium phosphoreum]